jgi:hypothetical protein
MGRAAVFCLGFLALAPTSTLAQRPPAAVPQPAPHSPDAVTIGSDGLLLPPGRRTRPIPASAILVFINRAYTFGSGTGRFCSPEISVFNQANRGVSHLMVAIEFYQPRQGVVRRVGSTHTRFALDPGQTASVGFARLSTDNCNDIIARASVSACLWRDRSTCDDRVVFSDSGQIPLHLAGPHSP